MTDIPRTTRILAISLHVWKFWLIQFEIEPSSHWKWRFLASASSALTENIKIRRLAVFLLFIAKHADLDIIEKYFHHCTYDCGVHGDAWKHCREQKFASDTENEMIVFIYNHTEIYSLHFHHVTLILAKVMSVRREIPSLPFHSSWITSPVIWPWEQWPPHHRRVT